MDEERLIDNEGVKSLMLERLGVLSSDTIISFGSETELTRDQLVESIKQGDDVAELFAEMQLEWLRSFKKLATA